VCLNRGHEVSLGKAFEPPALNAPLDLPRAHLIVTRETARDYQAVVAAVRDHLGGGTLVAGPDAPEIYFLTGTVNDTGRFFDFFEAEGQGPAVQNALERWKRAAVIVINHTPGFSPPLPAATVTALVEAFPEGRRFGRYEVRWR
jgi:hypothetical protein